jgi:hypothetical protein
MSLWSDNYAREREKTAFTMAHKIFDLDLNPVSRPLLGDGVVSALPLL